MSPLNKAVVAMALVGAAILTTGDTALAAARPGEKVTGTGIDNSEGRAYARALVNARDQCPNRNDVSLVTRDTRPLSNGRWWAIAILRCN